MPPRLAGAARLVAAAALMLALVAVPAGPAAAASPAAHAAKHKVKKPKRRKAKRCRRGTVNVKATKHHRRRCVKLKLPKHTPKLPSVHTLRTRALEHLPALRLRGRHGHGRRVKAPKLPRAMLRAVTRAERLWKPTATAHAARVHRRAHRAIRLNGWDVDFGDAGPDAATMTVHKGKESLKLTLGISAIVDGCPDEQGETKGRAPYIFNIDAQFRVDRVPDGYPDVAAKPSTAFIHTTSALRATAVSHGDDTAHLVDYDVRGKDTEYLQVGLKDAHGKVLATNPPALVTTTLSIDHVKAAPAGDKDRWTRDLLRHTTSSATWTDAADVRSGLDAAGFKWLMAIDDLSQAYQDAEAQHWQKDCLAIGGSHAPAKLRSSQHGQVLVTSVTAKGGTLKGPVPLTMTAEGAVAPTSARWTGTPIPLDYTAPAGDWVGSGVTVRAVSRMGVGTARFAFEHDEGAPVLRITSRITRSPAPNGSATYDLQSTIPLQYGTGDGPPVAFGSAPLTWNTFDYHDDGDVAYCQNGSTGVTNYDGTGAEPGRINVQQAFEWDPYSVTFTIVPPVEHYVSDTLFDDPACPDVHYTKDHTLWFNGLSALGGLPDVKINDPANPTSWTVGGFRDGTGDVRKVRDLDAGDVHLRIELLNVYG